MAYKRISPQPVVEGGTGAITITNHGIVIGAGTGALTATTIDNGQLLIGSTGAAPVAATLTAGAGIGIANAAGSITISADNAGYLWTVVTVAQTAADSNGYFCNDAGGVTVTLPAASAVGDTFSVCAMHAGGWTIAQGAGQQIFIGDQTTTAGVGGSLESTGIGDWVTLVCNVANTSWFARVEQGNILIT